MELNEIETKADELLDQMYKELPGPAGAAEMRDICTRMDVLERAARIKALCNSRAEHNVAPDLRQRELEPTGATGPLSEVRALIAMWNGYSRNQDGRAADQLLEDGDRRYAAGQSVAWGKAASILQEVMQKEGLL